MSKNDLDEYQKLWGKKKRQPHYMTDEDVHDLIDKYQTLETKANNNEHEQMLTIIRLLKSSEDMQHYLGLFLDYFFETEEGEKENKHRDGWLDKIIRLESRVALAKASLLNARSKREHRDALELYVSKEGEYDRNSVSYGLSLDF